MRIETVYIADDGTIFDDKDKCLAYDKYLQESGLKDEPLQELLKFKDELVIKEGQGCELSLCDIKEHWERVSYVYALTDNAAEALENYLCDYVGDSPWGCRPTKADAFYYDHDAETWISLTESCKFVKDIESHMPKGWKI